MAWRIKKNMKKFEYNLLGLAPPIGYRFLAQGERTNPDTDFWWVSNLSGMKNYLSKCFTNDYKCLTNYPTFVEEDLYVGYVRKI